MATYDRLGDTRWVPRSCSGLIFRPAPPLPPQPRSHHAAPTCISQFPIPQFTMLCRFHAISVLHVPGDSQSSRLWPLVPEHGLPCTRMACVALGGPRHRPFAAGWETLWGMLSKPNPDGYAWQPIRMILRRLQGRQLARLQCRELQFREHAVDLLQGHRGRGSDF